MRRKKKTFLLNVVIVAEKESKDLTRLAAAFAEQEMNAAFVPVGDIVLSVESGVPSVKHSDTPFDNVDGVFLQVPSQFMLFIEPFLTELTEQGMYCQLKPTSFNLLASKPFLYATLNTLRINMQATSLVSTAQSVEGALESHAYPIFIEAFQGIDKTQRMIIESKRTLTSFLKSLPFTFDILLIREFLKGDLYESVVIGDQVLTTRSKWNEKQLHHSKRRVSAKLPDKDRETVLNAAKSIGCDVALVKTIKGSVISVRPLVDIQEFGRVLSVDLYTKIAKYYKEKLE